MAMGAPDLAIADHASNNVGVLMNAGDGTFKRVTFYNVGRLPHSIRAGDLNGDGNIDLVTANDGSNNVSILYGTGTGKFVKAVNYATGQMPKGVELGDINGDGRLDIVTSNVAGNYPTGTNPAGRTISVLLGTNNGKIPRRRYRLTPAIRPSVSPWQTLTAMAIWISPLPTG